jgi:two-component system, cell cycle sensor histidine kinase and response regulator CckA
VSETHTGRTILLVDDEHLLRQITSQLLRRAGYAVLEAESPQAAVDAIMHHPAGIDLLLSDISFPEGNGIELFRQLSANNPELKVVFMSGHPAEVVRDEVQNPGAFFLEKPFEHRDILEMVRGILGEP